MSEIVKPARPEACAACPWRLANQGKRVSRIVAGESYGWYTKLNLRRLWDALRRGDRMTCHPTDSRQVQLSGKCVGKAVDTHECTGAVILVQREVMKLQLNYPGKFKLYYAENRHGLTKLGIAAVVERALFGRVARPDLNALGIQYPPLGEWEARNGTRDAK